MRSRRAVAQTLYAFLAEPLDPFGDRFGRRIELVGRVGPAQAALDHASLHRLSTFGRQRRILVDVHLVSPWNTEASQPQLPRFRPDGQPPERSKLTHPTIIAPDRSDHKIPRYPPTGSRSCGLRQRHLRVQLLHLSQDRLAH